MFKEIFESSAIVKYKGGFASDLDEIRKLADAYDFYTNYIDSNVQKAKKDKSNQKIKDKLSKMGVTEISSGDVTVKL